MTGGTSSRDQSGTYLLRTGPYPVRGGPVPVGGGSRGRREAVGDPKRAERVQGGKGVKEQGAQLYNITVTANLCLSLGRHHPG